MDLDLKERKEMYGNGDIPLENSDLRQIMLLVVNLKKRIDLAKRFSNDNLRASFKIEEFISQNESSK